MIGALALGLLAVAAQPAGAPAAPSPAPPAAVRSFTELWSDYVAAEAKGDAAGEAAAMREIRRARMQRNVESLGSVGLALVAHAVAKLRAGERDEAEQELRAAVALAPGLPDAHAALSLALLRRGLLAIPASLSASVDGVAAFLATGRGARGARDLVTLGALVTAFAAAWAIAVALLLRRGRLLLHDIEEWLGPAHHRSASLALFLLLLLLPVATFQGWGWLPLWWLALLLSYFHGRERALAGLLAATTLLIGPGVALLEQRLRTTRNPLYHAALAATESVPDEAAIGSLARAVQADPSDRDLVYLLGAGRKKAGRYDEAAELYRQVLVADPQDAVAANNLANLEFVRGSYESASARYRAGAASPQPSVAATSFYNLSLAHLQKFDYQAYNTAKASADRIAAGLVAEYDRWKYDTGEYAVVDLGLGQKQVWEKFEGVESGVAARNLLRGEAPPRRSLRPESLVNRFVVALGIAALAAFLLTRWRGRKAFTLDCRRCGTAFCRMCHLGQVTGGLCSQCYHLFVVRDGVSGPVRNRKMAEVQRFDARRERVGRLLSALSPGAGQIYGGWTLRGALLVVAWYAILGLLAAATVVPFTEVPRAISPPWLPLLAGVSLLLLWVIGMRFRPGPELELPRAAAPPRAAGARRARAGQGGA